MEVKGKRALLGNTLDEDPTEWSEMMKKALEKRKNSGGREIELR